MILDGGPETCLPTTHLDNSQFELDSEEEAFLKAETGTQGTEEPRKHIIKFQEEAYKVSSCLRADRAATLCFVHRFTHILAFVGSR
jgi:hypothetical protein